MGCVWDFLEAKCGKWRRSRIKSCRPRSTCQLGRAPKFPPEFLRPTSESGPVGRWAAHQRSEAGQGHGRFLPVTLPRERPDQRKRVEAGSHCPLTP